VSNATIAPDDLLADGPAASAAPLGQPGHERYAFLEVIGVGGMGEVWRARDRHLDRSVAVKVLKSQLAASAVALARFVDEARATARLQHPGIVPVYDAGQLDDGRAFFTMREIRGRTFSELVDDLHAVSAPGAWGVTADGWTMPRLVDGYRRACEAVAHAHARGFVHRDLKPDNLMAGPHGEILVLDWGIAVLTAPSNADDASVSEVFVRATGARLTGVSGTPAWMAPEQARGEPPRIPADVHALGAILHAILHGVSPFVGDDAESSLVAVMREQRRAVREDPRVPEELAALIEACLDPDPDARPADASVLARAVRDWQEGARRRAEADAHVSRAQTLRAQLGEATRERHAARRAATLALAAVPAWKPVEEKAEAWAREDAARALEERVASLEDALLRELELALTHVPDHPEAHAVLTDVFRARLEEAEEARDTVAARRAAARVERHDRAGRLSAWLAGDGALDLVTDVPAQAVLSRVVEVGRRLVGTEPRALGTTPLRDVPLGMGSWMVELLAEGRPPVRVPVHIGRGERWSAVTPDGAPLVVRLPRVGELGPDEVHVPAGPFRAGGDPVSATARSAARPWLDAFVLDRYPVTNAQWIAFLEDLLAQGREEDAARCVPRARDVGGREEYAREGDRYFLRPDAEGDLWQPDWPVMLIDSEAAELYARWRAARDGLPWRLPTELEWEKAARGVDGRWYPWGDHFDASWACVRESHRGRPLLAAVTAFPGDESPYGVRGLAGGVRDLCVGDGDPFVVRGGAWSLVGAGARAAHRVPIAANVRAPTTGVRLARSLPG
jgi:formylglycine-generating enzyme required for sulfatase activity/tRNA A-37 threonylcarbamoyl transferase component Bud32